MKTVVIITLLAAAFLWGAAHVRRFLRSPAARARAIAVAAHRRGMSREQRPVTRLSATFPDDPLLGMRSAWTEHRFTGWLDGLRLELFEHRYRVLVSNEERVVSHRVAVLWLPVVWPTVRARRVRRGRLHGGRGSTTTLRRSVRRRYRIDSADDAFTGNILTSAVQSLLCSRGASLAISRGALMWSEQGVLRGVDIEAMCKAIEQFIASLPVAQRRSLRLVADASPTTSAPEVPGGVALP